MPKKRIGALGKKVIIFTLIVLLCIAGCVVLLIWGFDQNTLGYDIVTALLTTLMSILVIGIVFQLYTNKEVRESLQQNILDSMAADPEILKKYNPETVNDILNNCFPALLGKFFSDQFVKNVVEKQIRNVSYRKDFEYAVDITNSTGDGCVIEQSLMYTKCLRREYISTPRFIKMFFAFGEDSSLFDDKDSLVFFREILTDQKLAERITAASSDEEVLKALDLSFEVNGKTIRPKKCELLMDAGNAKGVSFVFPLNKSQVRHQKEDNIMEFTGKMKCRYPSSGRNYFYCAFPEPTINANFLISFNGIGLENVSYDTFLTSDNYQLIDLPDEKGKKLIPLSEDSIIFPHSGAVFLWSDTRGGKMT